jgi:uridine kinase
LKPTKSILICITGGTGSGKSVLADALAVGLGPGKAVIVRQDWYYKDRTGLSSRRTDDLNYDNPDSLDLDLLAGQVKLLKQGCVIEAPVYRFTSHRRSRRTQNIHPAGVMILEGTLLLTRRDLRDLADIRIFVEADDDIRLIRRLQRDIRQRGRTAESVVEQWMATVKPMHEEYVQPVRRYADMILHDVLNQTTVCAVVHMIQALSTRHNDIGD